MIAETPPDTVVLTEKYLFKPIFIEESSLGITYLEL
jgi:hypothetical protein